MELSELQTHVENYVLDITPGITSLIPIWLNEAVRKAATRHNFQFMKAEAAAETSEGERQLLARPARWKERRARPWLLRQDGSVREIEWAPTQSEMIRMYGQAAPAEGSQNPIDDGRPRYLLEELSHITVFPFPDNKADWDDGNYRVYIPYWELPASMESNSDTNYIAQHAPFYLIYSAASSGFFYNRDEERGNMYMQKAEREFRQLRTEDKLAQMIDRPTLVPKPGVFSSRRRRRI